MRKKIFITGGIFLLFSFFTTFAIGQCYTVYYCSGCVSNGLCPESQTFTTYDEARASALNACPYAKPDIRPSNCGGPGPVHGGKLFASPLRSGIMGAILGGLGFSLIRDANGNNQVATGAAGGYFVFSLLSYIAEPKSRPVGVNIIFGAMTGAAGGYAGVKTADLIKNQTTPATTPAKKDNTPVIVAASAAAGAIVGGFTGFHHNTLGGKSSFMRKSKLLSNMAFTMSGNGIGIIVKL